MSLAYAVLQYVQAVKKNRTVALDDEFLQHLETLARERFQDAHYAQYAPRTDVTREAIAVLPDNVANTIGTASQEVEIVFPWPVEVLAFYVSITPRDSTFARATTDDALVSLNIDDFENLAARTSTQTDANGPTQFVTLTNYSVLSPRVMELALTAPTPRIAVTFKWKPQDSNPFKSHNVSIAAFARRMNQKRKEVG